MIAVAKRWVLTSFSSVMKLVPWCGNLAATVLRSGMPNAVSRQSWCHASSLLNFKEPSSPKRGLLGSKISAILLPTLIPWTLQIKRRLSSMQNINSIIVIIKFRSKYDNLSNDHDCLSKLQLEWSQNQVSCWIWYWISFICLAWEVLHS